MKKIFTLLVTTIIVLVFFAGAGFGKPTPLVLTSTDGKASLVITDWGLDHDITVSISNPVFSEHSGFFRVTVWAGGHGTVHPHDTQGSHFGFYGKITAKINNSKMSANGGVVQGRGATWKSGDSDGQWQFGWASLNGNIASVPLNNGGTIYGFPSVIVIGSALPNDDRSKQLMGSYSNNLKGYLMIKSNGPDIGNRDAFQFIEIENPVFDSTYQGHRAAFLYDIDTIDANASYVALTGGMDVQGWIDDSALATEVGNYEAFYIGSAYRSAVPCRLVTDFGSWVWVDSPYHELSSLGMGSLVIGYRVPACL